MRNEMILPEIEYGTYRAVNLEAMDIPLNVYEREILKLMEKTFSSNKQEALAIIKTDEAYKIVRSRKSYIFQSLSDEEFSKVLSDYEAYLDFLFLHGVEAAYTTEANQEAVELMIKTLVSYFEVNVGQKQDGRVVKIYDGVAESMNNHSLFFRPEDIRYSFNADFLKKIQYNMEKKTPSENSKNKVGIEHIGEYLKNNPRLKMKVLEYDPYISDSQN